MSETSTNGWNTEIEVLLNQIRTNAIDLEEFHKGLYFKLKGLLVYFNLPVIILSSINALVAVALTSYLPQNVISGMNAGISFVIGTLTSIGMYLKINDRLENELEASKAYHKLSIEIYKVLSLKIDDRNTDGGIFMNEVYGEYIKLFERSNLMDIDMKDKLKLELPFGVEPLKIISK